MEAFSARGKTFVNVVLLGTGQSGKSTIVKQLRALFKNEYSDKERAFAKDCILINCAETIQKLIGCCRKHIQTPDDALRLLMRVTNTHTPPQTHKHAYAHTGV
jgi:hypothetical protein